jgi:hypothetical protein
MDEAGVRLLLDRAEISDVVHRYATAIDLRDWALLETCFTAEMEADFRTFGVREVFQGSADEWVRRVRSTIDGCDATQHLSANHVHTIDGDAATCVSYMRAEHFLINDRGDDSYTVGGYYTNELVREAAGWKIKKYTLAVTWSRGNRHILAIATRRAAGGEG